jgi:DNA-binding SARP family transcriptional activator/predicted ATPase
MTRPSLPRRLSLRLLGAPQILVDGVSVATDTRKAIALLAYLAVSGSPQSREAIASLLWPEYDATHAGAALRRTLSVTRSALGGRWLVPSGRLLQLETGDLRCDVIEFRAALTSTRDHHQPGADTHDLLCDRCRRRLERAVDLQRGPFLEGFSLRDSLEFDDWQAGIATELRAELADALQRLSEACAEAGDVDRALRHARRWLALDPLHEPAHRRLMELHAASGDRAAALRQYRECVRVLDDELGVAPLPETTATYQHIAAGEVAASPTASPAATARQPAKPLPLPLVGRAVELARLAAVYDSSTERGRLAFVEGEAGIGKSRLADELAALVNAHGGRLLATRGYRGESNLAYASISDALSRAAAVDTAWLAGLPPRVVANVAQLVPELGRGVEPAPASADLDEEAARGRFLADLARCLAAALAGSPPGLLLVDDGQWLDDASVAVLAHLVRRIGELRMCIVVCERSDELVGDRLEGLKRDARRDGVLDEIVLDRLGPDDVRSLASASNLAPDVAQALFERSEGIPFFVVEYLELLRTGDRTLADAERLPQGIRDLVASRLEMVSAEARQVLATAAVIGRSFDGSLVRRASGRSAEETVRALEELLRMGLVRERAAGSDYDFDHEVTREVLLAETSLARRRLLHRRIAEALRERPAARSGQAAQIAAHYAAAGDDHEAASYLRRAGEEAERLFANREALEHYRAALALDSADAAELHRRIGDLETLLGRYAEAVASYESAAAIASAADLGLIEHQLAKVHHRRGEWALAETHYLAALSALPQTDANRRARIFADRSLTAHRRGYPDGARAFAGQALELASSASDNATLAQVHNLLGILAKGAGALDEARSHLEQSLEHAVEHPWARIAAMNNLALVERAAGQAERAVELTRAALRLCLTLGDRHREAALRNNLADLLHAGGRRDEAMAELRQSVTIFAEIGEPGTMQPEIWKLVEW